MSYAACGIKMNFSVSGLGFHVFFVVVFLVFYWMKQIKELGFKLKGRNMEM